jgi:hypothetical protein
MRSNDQFRGHCRIAATTGVALGLLAVGSAAVAGQDAETADRASRGTPIYLTAGVGTGTKAIAGQLGISVAMPVGQVTARWSGVSDLDALGPSSSASDVALLFGLRRVQGTIWYGVAGGPGLVWVAQEAECLSYSGSWPLYTCTRYAVERERAPGFAFQSVVGWRFVSLSALGNVNRLESFAAVTANLHVGRTR